MDLFCFSASEILMTTQRKAQIAATQNTNFSIFLLPALDGLCPLDEVFKKKNMHSMPPCRNNSLGVG